MDARRRGNGRAKTNVDRQRGDGRVQLMTLPYVHEPSERVTCTSCPTWNSPASRPKPSEGPIAKSDDAGAHSASLSGGGGGSSSSGALEHASAPAPALSAKASGKARARARPDADTAVAMTLAPAWHVPEVQAYRAADQTGCDVLDLSRHQPAEVTLRGSPSQLSHAWVIE